MVGYRLDEAGDLVGSLHVICSDVDHASLNALVTEEVEHLKRNTGTCDLQRDLPDR